MRVLSVLSLLCVGMLGVSSQYVMDPATTNSNWKFSSPASVAGVDDAPLTFTAGNTYTFDVSLTTSHPFNFSTASSDSSVTAIDSAVYTVAASAGCTVINNKGWAAAASSPAGTCTVNLTIAANAPNATIYYQCTVHAAMSGPITIVAAAAAGATTVTPTTAAPTTAAPTTASPTTAAPTTAAPTGNGTTTVAPTTAVPTGNGTTTVAPTTAVPTAPPGPLSGQTLVGTAFSITGALSNSAYIFSAGGKTYSNPTLQINGGSTVTFSIDFPGEGHPFGFSFKGNKDAVTPTTDYFPTELNSPTEYSLNAFCKNVTGVNANLLVTPNANNSCVITVQTPKTSSTLYYRCGYHPAMVGAINILGNTAAATITGAGMAMMLAIIATIMM